MKFWTLFLVLFISCGRQEFDKSRVESIGQSLIKLDTINKTESSIPDIVFLGQGLLQKISHLKTKTTKFNTKVEKGDFKEPFGNNQADCILTIKSDIESIGIRLKYNKNKDKYDILGWMTLTAVQN